MLSFSEYIFLSENRKEFFKKTYTSFDTSHEMSDLHSKKPDNIIDLVMSHDPDQKKHSNSQWMLNQYKSKNFRQEDLPRIKGHIEKFHSLKKELPSQDLNAYTLNQETHPKKMNLVDHLRSQEHHNESFPDGPRFEGHPGATKMFDDGKGTTIHSLDTHEAGRAARDSCGHDDESGGWCFGWKKPTHFNDYSEQGAIHLIQTPDNRKFAIHFPSAQLMDKDDGEVKPSDLVKKYPSLKGARFYPSDHDDERMKWAFHTDLAKKHATEHAFEAGDDKVMAHIEDNNPELIKPHHVEQAMEHYRNGILHPQSIIHLPHFKQEHMDEIWENEKKGKQPHFYIRDLAEFVPHTNNRDHLHQFYTESNKVDVGHVHTRHLAGSRLYHEFGETPPLIKNKKSGISEHSMKLNDAKRSLERFEFENKYNPTRYLKNQVDYHQRLHDYHQHMIKAYENS